MFINFVKDGGTAKLFFSKLFFQSKNLENKEATTISQNSNPQMTIGLKVYPSQATSTSM
jgi:hypothetical protein